MTSIGNGHLTDKQLLLYVDGELTAKENARCRAHVKACWTCRAKLDDLHGTIKKIVDFRNDVLLPMVPLPPKPWDGLDPHMRKLEETLGKQSIAERLSRLFRPGFLAPRYAISAFLVLIVLGALVWLPSQPAISANELLARVQEAQAVQLNKVTAPVIHQRLRVSRRVAKSDEQVTTDYDSWEDLSRGRFHQTTASEEVLAELRTICNANRLDWQAPLSAAGYARWRDSLLAKRDIVAPAKDSTGPGVQNGSEPLVLTTTPKHQAADHLGVEAAEQIAKAELVVRTTDWHPVRERLWVNDREYEIAELDYKVLPLAAVDAAVFAPPPEPVAPSRTATVEKTETPRPDPEETEMAVRYKLHALDADLGEPIEISHGNQGNVIVDASSAAPELQTKLEEQLAAIPNAGLVLDKPPAPTCDTCSAPSPTTHETVMQAPTPSLRTGPTVNPNEKRLAEVFGDPKAQESFTQAVLSVSGNALSQGFALRNLALRYPADVEANLTPVAKVQLLEMVNDHLGTLGERSSRLQGFLLPLLEALSNARPPGIESPRSLARGGPGDEAGVSVGTGPSGDLIPGARSQWQNASFEIFAAVRKTDRLVWSLLGRTNDLLPIDEVVPELRRAFSEQQKVLARYQDLIPAEKAIEK